MPSLYQRSSKIRGTRLGAQRALFEQRLIRPVHLPRLSKLTNEAGFHYGFRSTHRSVCQTHSPVAKTTVIIFDVSLNGVVG
jgi:hypothetical protein